MSRLLMAIACAALAAGQTADRALLAELQPRLEILARNNDGLTAVAVLDLTTGQTVAVNGNIEMVQASVIKVPILWQAMEAAKAGSLDLNKQIELTASDRAGGSGELQRRLEGGNVRLTVRRLLQAMIEDSDNTATNKAIALVGMENVNRTLLRLGLTKTKLRRVMMDSAASRAGRENVSTALEMARLLEMIWKREQSGDAAAREMTALMKLVRGQVRGVVPASIPVAAKTGSLDGTFNEAAIVYLERRPYAIVVMNCLRTDERNTNGDFAGAVHDVFRRIDSANVHGNRVY